MRLLRDNVEMKLGLSINAPARQPVEEEEEEDAKLRGAKVPGEQQPHAKSKMIP